MNIPVDWNNPTREDLNNFMEAMDANKDKKIHVHCQANFRASAFVAMYRILKSGWKFKDAFASMHTIWNEAEYPVWDMFIENTLKTSADGS